MTRTTSKKKFKASLANFTVWIKENRHTRMTRLMKTLARENRKVDFKSLPWETPMIGARFKAYQEDKRKLRLVEISKEFVELDWCRKGHIGFVLDGEMEIDFDDEVVHFGPGDGLFIPAGETSKHMARVLTDVVKLISDESLPKSPIHLKNAIFEGRLTPSEG